MIVLYTLVHLLGVVEAFHDHELGKWKQGKDGQAWHLIDAASWTLIFAGLGYGAQFGFGDATIIGTVAIGIGARLTTFALLLNLLGGHGPFHLGSHFVDTILGYFGDVGALIVRFIVLGLGTFIYFLI